jgi:RNA polymerase sigma factor (sigma-70 family)
MDMRSNVATRITLLKRLQHDQHDREAWREFVAQYSPMIFAWCRRWGLQEADAEDITQMVLLKLTQKMTDFAYDPRRSFRAWLKAVAHNTLCDFRRSNHRMSQGSGDSELLRLLENAQAEDDLVK